MCDTTDMDDLIEFELTRDDCIEMDDTGHGFVETEFLYNEPMNEDYEIVETLEEEQISHHAIDIKPEILQSNAEVDGMIILKTEPLGTHEDIVAGEEEQHLIDEEATENDGYEEDYEYEEEQLEQVAEEQSEKSEQQIAVPDKIVKQKAEHTNAAITEEDKQKTTEVQGETVHRRYMLFDELVACIVDYDTDGTPIVEFSISNTESDEKLPVECGICPEIMSRTKIAKHLKTHLVPGTNRYQCVYCDETYKDCKYLAGHARRHMGIRPYVCESCKLYFSTKQDLRVHNQRRHQEKDHVCEVCGKSFAQNTQLKRHREATHEKKRRFQCEHCPKSYYKNFSLQEHVRAVHMGKRRMIVCPFCGMQCRDAHKMARHRKQMHLHQTHFECHICNEEFTDINYFDAHKRSIQCRNNTKRKLEEEALLKEQNGQQGIKEEKEKIQEVVVQQHPQHKTEILSADEEESNEHYINEFDEEDGDDDGMEQQTVQIITEEDIKHLLPQQHHNQPFTTTRQYILNNNQLQHHKVEILNGEDGNGDEELVYEITIDSNE